MKTTSAGAWYRQIIGNYGVANSPSSSNFFGLGWMAGGNTNLGFAVRVSNATVYLYNSSETYKDGQWHHLVGTKQGSTLALYVDGIRVATNSFAGNPYGADGQSRIRMGAYIPGSNFAQGTFDEPRISSDVRSSNWVWACWMNQGASNNAFQSYGMPVPGGAVPTYTLTVNSAYGTPTPSGVTTNVGHTLVNAYIAGSPAFVGMTQYVANGWIATGSLADGTGTNTSFTITNNTTISWQWTTNFWIDFSVIGN